MEPNPQAKIDLLLLQEQMQKEDQRSRNRLLEVGIALGVTTLCCIVTWARSGAVWAGLSFVSAAIPVLMIRSGKSRTKLTGWILLLSTLIGGIAIKPDSLINPGQIKQLQQQTQQLQSDQ